MRRLLFALLVLMATPALAQNQLPAIQGPSGYQLAAPTVNIGYDSGTGAACVVGKTPTCALLVSSSSSGGVVTADQGAAGVSPWAVNIAQYGGTTVDPNAGTSVSELYLRRVQAVNNSPANSDGFQVSCVRDTANTAVTNGWQTILRCDSRGNQYVTMRFEDGTTPWANATGPTLNNSGGNSALVMGTAYCDETSITAITENNVGVQRLDCSSHGLITQPYASQAASWSYAAASGGITNTTTGVTVKAAAGTGLRNCIRSAQIAAGTLGAATEVVFNDGAAGTTLNRTYVGTSGGNFSMTFEPPLCGTANTLIEAKTVTATVTGGVYIDLQGHVRP